SASSADAQDQGVHRVRRRTVPANELISCAPPRAHCCLPFMNFMLASGLVAAAALPTVCPLQTNCGVVHGHVTADRLVSTIRIADERAAGRLRRGPGL